MAHGQGGAEISFDRSPTLTCIHEAPIILDRAAFNQGANAQYKFRAEHSETMDSLVARGPHAVLQPIAFSGCDDGMDSQINVTPTMRIAGNAQGNLAVAVGTDLYNGNITGDVAATMGTPGSSSNASGPTVMQPIGFDAYNNDITGDVSKTIDTGQDYHHVPNIFQSMAVRRLTPVECERLQGFPDSYTDIKSKNKPTPDGPRYKALGNSMAVPVMAWIGQRIEQVEAICKQNK
jgi:DNA (cytosine-5)-methyltransferase 1